MASIDALHLNPSLRFHRDGAFFDLVVTFLAATAGLTPVFDTKHYPNFLTTTDGVYRGVVRPETRVDLAAVITHIRGGGLSAIDAVNQLCCMLATSAWDAAELGESDPLWSDPAIQFFRFVRHAAAHGNRWHFEGSNPKSLAMWRATVLSRTMHGRQCFGLDMMPGDLLLLLMDIEGKLPAAAGGRTR